MVGGERELVATARRSAVDHANGGEAGGFARVLDAVSGLVGELAEIHLVGVGGAREHADVGAGAEHARLGRAQKNDLHPGMLEAQALDRVGKLDVDAEIVGIELELVALEQRAFLVDVHQQRRDLTVHLDLPMPIFRGIGLEVDPALAVGQFSHCVDHGVLTTSFGRVGGDIAFVVIP